MGHYLLIINLNQIIIIKKRDNIIKIFVKKMKQVFVNNIPC